MEEYLSLMHQTALFKGLSSNEILTALDCLKGTVKVYTKKEIVLHTYSSVHSIGVILEGTIYLNTNNSHGERLIFSELQAGDLFGENCLWNQDSVTNFEVEAADTCNILFIERDKILHPEKTTCGLRQKIVENLFHLLLANNQSLYQKIDLFSQKNLREQIIYYLQLQKRKNNSSSFTISFSRQELADYLSVNRSALSRELAKMQVDRLIDYDKNSFTLLI